MVEDSFGQVERFVTPDGETFVEVHGATPEAYDIRLVVTGSSASDLRDALVETARTHSSAKHRPSVVWDDERAVVQIEGVKYSYGLFKEVGAVVEAVGRDDGSGGWTAAEGPLGVQFLVDGDRVATVFCSADGPARRWVWFVDEVADSRVQVCLGRGHADSDESARSVAEGVLRDAAGAGSV